MNSTIKDKSQTKSMPVSEEFKATIRRVLTAMDFKNFWVAEYSASQRCFHVATLESALVANTSMVIEKNNNDYLMFWVGETREEANAACDAMAELHKGG